MQINGSNVAVLPHLRRLPGDVRLPAKSTIHALLDRHGLVKRMGKRRSRAIGTPLSNVTLGIETRGRATYLPSSQRRPAVQLGRLHHFHGGVTGA